MRTLLLGLVIGAVACTPAVEETGSTRVIGVIQGYNEGDPQVEVPAAVQAGEPFEVSVVTYGNGCFEQDTTDVEMEIQNRAVVTAYDHRADADVCTMILKMFDHRATIEFDQPGTATVVFRGYGEADGALISVERDVTVR